MSISTPIFSNTFGGRSDFRLSIRYAGTPDGWLSVTPASGVTPLNVVLTANPSNLPAGAYLAQVVAEFSGAGGSAVKTVLFTVAPGGANAAGLTASPSSLVFLPGAYDPQTIPIMNTPGVSGIIAFRSIAASSGWLSITQSSQSAPASINVQVDPTGLEPGTHTGTIIITTATQSNTVIPVSIIIADTGIGSNIVLTPAQRSLTFNVQIGNTLNPTQTVYVSSGSTQATYFTASTSGAWLGVAAASWLSPASTTRAFAPGLLYVSVDPTGLAAGAYKGTLNLSGNGSSVDVPVTLNVSANAVLNSDPSYLSLDAGSNSLTANLAVTATDTFYCTASVAGGASWLSVFPSAAIVSNNITNLTVTARADGLPGGTYPATITLVGPGGTPTLNIPVQLTVSGQTASSSIPIWPDTLEFSATAGDSIPPQLITLGGGIYPTESYTLAATSETGWLSVDPILGSGPLLARVMVNPATPAGLYAGSILITSLTTQRQATIKVKFTSTARVMTTKPAILTFTQHFNSPAPASQEVQVTANAPSVFRVSAQPAWIKAPPGPFTTPAKFVVTADPTGMAPGSYEGSVKLAGPNTVTLQVGLTVEAPQPAAASPSSLSFAYELGAPQPASQTVNLDNPAGSTTFAALPSTSSGVNWLAVTPASGSTPGALTVSIKTPQLTPGQHTGAITVTFGNNAIAPITVSVTLTVTGTPVQVQQVLNAASLAPTSIAPGQIVTLTGLGLGPSSLATARPSGAGAFATELAGVQVFFDGVAAPLLAAQEAQINAIVPYAVFGRSSARLQVLVGSSYSLPIDLKVVAAAPGIFTSGPSGRGQAAALNLDGSVNSVLNPAQRGSVVVVYLTGEGQTDPPGQDGRVISSDLRKPLAAVTASIGGHSAEVLYAGSSPNQVAGLCQVNIRIPEDVDPGTQPIEIRVGDLPSQSGVTVALR